MKENTHSHIHTGGQSDKGKGGRPGKRGIMQDSRGLLGQRTGGSLQGLIIVEKKHLPPVCVVLVFLCSCVCLCVCVRARAQATC